MLIDLTFENVKYIVMQFKTNLDNINFSKLNPGMCKSFNDNFWDCWIFDTYLEMCTAFPNRQTEEFPPPQGTIPLEEYM